MSVSGVLKRRLCALVVPAVLVGCGLARADVVAHWSFDALSGSDGKRFADSTGKFNALIDDPAQVKVDSTEDVPFKGAASFTGNSGGTLDIPPIPAFRSGSFTVAAWVKLTEDESSPVIADWYKPNFAFNFGFEKKSGSAPRLVGWLRNTQTKTDKKTKRTTTKSVEIIRFQPEPAVSLDKWHHVAWVWDRIDEKHGRMTAYLDGKQVVKVEQNKGVSSVDIEKAAHNLRIGFRSDPPTYFHGEMDELWIFNTALSVGEVHNLMRSNDISNGEQLAFAEKRESEAKAAAEKEAAEQAAAEKQTPAEKESAHGAAEKSVEKPAEAAVAAAAGTSKEEGVSAEAAENRVAESKEPADATVAKGPSQEAAVKETAPEEGLQKGTHARPAEVAEAPHLAAPTFTVNPKTLSVPRSSAAPIAPIKAVAAQRAGRYSPGRVAGLIASGAAALVLSGFLLWAAAERSRMHHP